MDLNRFTQKSQEAVQQAQALTSRYGHVEIDNEHLLLALLEQHDGLIPRLLTKMELAPNRLREAVETELAKRPHVSGPGIEAGKIYITQRLQQLIIKAKSMSEFVIGESSITLEHCHDTG